MKTRVFLKYFVRACSGIKNEKILNKEISNYKNQLLEFFLKKQKYTYLLYNIWGADLADMQLISKFNKRICFLLGFIDISSKYDWVIA